MIAPSLSSVDEIGSSPSSSSRRDEFWRSLAPEIRFLLAEIRAASRALGAALFVHDEGNGSLRLYQSVPNRSSRTAVHPLSGTCAVSRALRLQKRIRRRPRRDGAPPDCEICRRLFDAPTAFAVPVAVSGGQTVVVAVFAASSEEEKSTPYPRRLLEHLGTYLNACMAAQQAKRRASELAAINEVAAKLTSVIDAEVLFPKVLAEISRVIRYDLAGLYLFDREQSRLRVAADYGYSAEQRHLLEETAWERVPGAVFRSQRPLIIRDRWRELPVRSRSMQIDFLARVRSSLWAPIVFNGDSLGVIGLGSLAPDAFAEEDMELVSLLANHAAIAVANAQLYRQVDERLQGKLRDLINLSRIGQAMGASLQTDTVLWNVVRGTTEAFEPSASQIMLLDEENNQLVSVASYGTGTASMRSSVPVDGSASGWVVRRRQPLVVPSISESTFDLLRSWFDQEEVGTFAAVPLIAHEKAIGSLNVYTRRGQGIGANDVELLQGLAAQAATAIDHARLYESVEREKARFEAIVESLHEGLLLADSAGAIVYANRRLVDLLGLVGTVSSGTTQERLWDHLASTAVSQTEAQEALAALGAGSSHPVVIGMAQPQRRDLELQGFAVLDPMGGLLGRGYLVRDITRQAEVERLKSSLLSTVSHELRSPLTAIKGFSSSLLRTDVEWSDENKRDFIEQIDLEADRLNELVCNLLDMSRLEAGTLRIEREWCDLRAVVGSMVANLEPIVSNHRLRLSLGDGQLLAFFDRRCIERVVWNLVENAAKYSPRGSTITIAVARANGNVTLTVSDEGSGVRLEERQKIFERFYRGTAARKVAGAGLGLAICKGIVEAHGGCIEVDSEVGRGSDFSMQMPCPEVDGLA